LIIINTDALIEILDKQSEIGQQIVEKIQKSNDGFAITALTLMKVLHGFIKLQKIFHQYTHYGCVNFLKRMLKKQ
jgi:hypothetical protein